ncbi:MAG: aminotransferase class I/II-fold pyridoxal phosphate-dependent enzyme [Deltaproteobacteria bacterium]|nr:aminotransferase class I/II-fold pyridoxal phosphate-dependent enzyme [Deltaproteobacteria bacterium]MBW2446841.1 aminotransferase class I/II-fold pyridoxal phosphate-dependent enzyme [Deltaproteobacteria bacterium]
MNPLAAGLNADLEKAAPEVLAMLSERGKRLYFPKGILSQGAEAKAKAKRFNATIGIATEGDEPMNLPSLMSHFEGLNASEALDYAPPAGIPVLRERWREKLLAENPSLADKSFGDPIVTAAITHGLSLVGDLFIDPGDKILLPDKLWGNYRLIYEVRLEAEIATFPFYDGEGFDVAGFEAALAREAEGCEKLVVLLNFPNNPTGYMPTVAEGDAMAKALLAQAERGTKLVVVTDDAYFGLFYHLGGESMRESLFGQLIGAHPNLLAVKLDGATKELFVWGLRCGFITLGPGRAATADTVIAALEAKIKGAIRGAISNSPKFSQSLVAKALASPTIAKEREQKSETLRLRAQKVYDVANEPRYAESFEVYPFNSGYFMCLNVTGVDAEDVRVRLLNEYETGLVATSKTDLRVAFSCLEVDDIEPLFELIHRAIQELRKD